jgi:hypothetical protein
MDLARLIEALSAPAASPGEDGAMGVPRGVTPVGGVLDAGVPAGAGLLGSAASTLQFARRPDKADVGC